MVFKLLGFFSCAFHRYGGTTPIVQVTNDPFGPFVSSMKKVKYSLNVDENMTKTKVKYIQLYCKVPVGLLYYLCTLTVSGGF